ncbi:MAG: class I SAM-dependent methyltransferase [Bacteroidales bacterium]|nr:class I SAM-dependent methyltransferase [Bacteroidales bacterium]MDD4672610.1 class I SAM-dependent methyltransferase [Bacteroidales bacterium]MDY0348104.1 class I SAM-dependent methyltransferase [Tenuifilaceae bacterium]
MSNHSGWDKRYSNPDFIYGTEPNKYLCNTLKNLKPGSLLLPGEGEGRNALWAAKHGWDVTAFDSSSVAQQKALNLFKQHSVNVSYLITDIQNLTLSEQFNAIGMVFVHLERSMFAQAAKKLTGLLKPNGHLIIEMFNQNQLHLNSGGPKNPNFFVTPRELKTMFNSLTIIELKNEEVYLDEGPLHQGKAMVIRMHAVK